MNKQRFQNTLRIVEINRFGSSLEPMSHVQVFSYEKEGRDLVTVSGCDLIDSFFDMQKNMESAFTLSYFSELIEDSRPSVTEDDVLFRLLLETLKALRAGGDLKFLTAYFEIWFLKLNGFLPELTRCSACRRDITGPAGLSPKKDGAYCEDCATGNLEQIPAEFPEFLDWTRKHPPAHPYPPSLSAEILQEIRHVLKQLIVFHMERAPKSLSFLDQD